jgi:excisionase family DNA binding protein
MDRLAYSVEDGANLLGIGRTLMFDLVRRGDVPSIKVGKRRLIPARALSEWVDRQQVEQAA